MTTVKTREMTGPALDWAVAKAVGYSDWVLEVKRFLDMHAAGHYNYSTDWSQGGPIIAREGIATWHSVTPEHGLWAAADARWMALDPDSDEFLAMPDPYHGPTILIAAMRCLVASKLGESVDIPYELGAQA